MELFEKEIRLDEITIVDDLLPPNPELLTWAKNARQIGLLGDAHVTRYDEGSDSLLAVVDTGVLAYIICREEQGYHWVLEARSFERGQGWAARLIAWTVQNMFRPLFVDRSLTNDAVKMIERLITSGAVNASIADLEAGAIIPYRDDFQMYDQRVIGINRVPTADAERYTWVLESRVPRGGMLSEYVRKGPVGLPPGR